MRFDNIGLFWQDIKTTGRRNERVNVMVPTPDTRWTAPALPRLSDAKVLSVDVETKDLDLLERGPGWARGAGHIVGVAIGADKDGRWYFPLRHELEPETNLDPANVIPFLKDALSNPLQPKVGANLTYDLGWLGEEGIEVAGDLYDVQYAEALLHETGEVNLDFLGRKYLGQKKESELLYEWCAKCYGGPVSGKQRANIYRTAPRLAGPYAEGDVDLPLRILPRQYKLLREQNLVELFEKENRLMRLLIKMRRAGVRIDVARAEELREKLAKEIVKQTNNLKALAGRSVDVYSGQSIAKAFKANGLSYKKTKKGNPSFQKEFLKAHSHPIAKKIVEIKELEKLKGTFIESYILDSHVNGKVFTQFHPLRGESGGTRSGRFSSSTPNLQNIPSRDKILAPLVRGLFLPDEGHEDWIKMDYSQIEYRFLAHFAQGEGAQALRAAYNENAFTDYHALTQELVRVQTGVELNRKATKNINFGFIYGMGKQTLAKSLGLTTRKAEALFTAYHRGAPFAKATMNYYSAQAINQGFVETISNRRSRFDLFEPSAFRIGEDRAPALPYEKALRTYGPMIQRAFSHKALNRVLQGSAAELLKEAMLQCYELGLFKETGVPRLTVHDELDFSNPGGKDNFFREVKRVFQNAIKLNVPVLVDVERGPDWGHVKKAEGF